MSNLQMLILRISLAHKIIKSYQTIQIEQRMGVHK